MFNMQAQIHAKVLLKWKLDWFHWFGFSLLILVSLLILTSSYFYFSIVTLYPLFSIVRKAPYQIEFSRNHFVLKYIFKTERLSYNEIFHVELLFPTAKHGHLIHVKLKNKQQFSISYVNEFWTEDLCNLLHRDNVKIHNHNFNWLVFDNDLYKANSFYQRNDKELKRKTEVMNSI
jgi:hypothetical protein